MTRAGALIAVKASSSREKNKKTEMQGGLEHLQHCCSLGSIEKIIICYVAFLLRTVLIFIAFKATNPAYIDRKGKIGCWARRPIQHTNHAMDTPCRITNETK
jgi:hypothetical protein